MNSRFRHRLPHWAAAIFFGFGVALNAGAQTEQPFSYSSDPVANQFMQSCFSSSQESSAPAPGCEAFYGVLYSDSPGGGSNAEALGEVVQQIEPNQVPMLTNSTFLQQGQMTAVHSRLVAVHKGGGRGISVLNMPLYKDVADSRPIAGTGSAGDDKAFADTPWGFFISGSYQNGDVDSSGNQDGFDYSTRSITAGIDYRIGNSLVLGGSLARGSTENKVKNHRGSADVDNWAAWFYGSYFPGEHVYVDWSLGYGHNDYDGKRRIDFESFGESFSSGLTYDTDGRQYNASVTGGYDGNIGAWQYAGYLSLDWLKSTIDGYREHGGDGFALAIDKQNAVSLLSSLGGRINHPFSLSTGVLVPGIDAAFVHQWRDEARRVNATFVDLPGAGGFSITSRELDKTYFNIALSLTGVFKGGQSAYLRYQTVAARSDVSEHIIEAGYRLEF